MSLEAVIDLLDDLIQATLHPSDMRAYFKPFAFALPFRWELHSSSPQRHLGTIQLSASEIVECRTMERDALAKFVRRKVDRTLRTHVRNVKRAES